MKTKKLLDKGFTLVELLIVIGILAVLAAIVIVVLNPAQLLAQARDSERISDLGALHSTLALYLGTVPNPILGTTGSCYVYSASAGAGFSAKCGGTASTADDRASSTTTGVKSASKNVDGSGWIPVDFTAIAAGSPFSVLPSDPVNDASSTAGSPVGLFYVYIPDQVNKTYEINANLESIRFSTGGNDDKESADGGSSNQLYEVGTKLDL